MLDFLMQNKADLRTNVLHYVALRIRPCWALNEANV